MPIFIAPFRRFTTNTIACASYGKDFKRFEFRKIGNNMNLKHTWIEMPKPNSTYAKAKRGKGGAGA